MGRTSIRSHLSLAPALGVLQESAAPGLRAAAGVSALAAALLLVLAVALPKRLRPLRRALAVGALLCGVCTGLTLHAAARPAPAAPPETAAPIAAASPAPVRTPAPAPASAPTASPRPTPTPTPQPRSWTISFAGDCTIGTLFEWRDVRAANNMLYVVGEDYGYPLSNVRGYFAEDDFTLVNFEGTFTERLSPVAKAYRFSAPARYAAVLTDGGVEAVSLANNHAGDFGQAGGADTRAALDAAGVRWGDGDTPIIAELSGGLLLGVVPFNAVEIDLAVGDLAGYEARFSRRYDECAAAGCDVIVAFVHWGWEYRYTPEPWMTQFAHDLVDLGCDLVVGSHPHVIQPMELYQGVPIFYSLGNFCFGGHSDPADQDCVLLRQQFIETAAGGVVRGETEIVPCRISSTDARNDFRPTPYAADSAGCRRVLEKLGLS